jgi:hypothetical protein
MDPQTKPLPRIREISVRPFEEEPRTIVLTVKGTLETEYQAAIGSADAGSLVASLITSVGNALGADEIPARRTQLASNRVFIEGAGIGFGDTPHGPVLVTQTGGLALVFSVSRRDLFDMARHILDDLQTIDDIDGPPRHH